MGGQDRGQQLLKATDVPAYVREESIETGYRQSLGYVGCLKSMFCLHNETVNIWSHMVGFLYFLWLLVGNLKEAQPHIRTTGDRAAVSLQLVTYQACMLTSSLFHTFLCHSEAVKASWQAADHAGILVALWGTYIRVIVTNFSCFPEWLACHLVVISLLCSLGLLVKLRRRGKGVRGRTELPLFLGLALYGVAPFAHWLVIVPSLAQNTVTLQMVMWLFVPYLLGGVGLFFYLSRLPECLLSHGTVDLCGASHQIWHVLIFAGMVSWYELTSWLSTSRPLSCQLKSAAAAAAQLTNHTLASYF